jgi:hypothetical protein
MSEVLGHFVQTAIYETLVGDSALGAFVGTRVFDDVPEDGEFPYVTIGTAEENDALVTDGTEGSGFRWQIDCWSRKGGRKEAYAMLSAIKAALHRRSLDVEGATHVMTYLETSMVLKDSDLETYHGVAVFRILVDAA